MRIAHLINNLGSGGAERLLVDLLPYLNSKDHYVILVVLNHNNSMNYNINSLLSYGVKIVNIDYNFKNPLIVLKLINLTSSLKLDLWHCHTFPAQYWLSFASYFFGKEVKLVKTEHAVLNNRMKYEFFNYVDRLIYHRYDKLIAISTQIAINLNKIYLISNSKISLIENGVNLFRVRNTDITKINEFNNSYFNVAMVARFDGWQKDHRAAIESMCYVGDDVRLYFVGDGPKIEYFKALVVKMKLEDRVFFLGLRDDVYFLMRSADLNILVSNFEGVSGVVLESLASGKPFCGSNVSGIKEFVPNNEFLFDSNDSKLISEKILRIKNSVKLQKYMVAQSDLFIGNFSHEISAEKINQLYNEL